MSIPAYGEGGVPPNYYDWREVFPDLQFVIDAWRDIRDEAQAIQSKSWKPWPERNLYRVDQGQDWKVVPFMYTFPANDESKRTWVESSCCECPKTAAILQRLGPRLRTALFSRMAPHTSLASHQGWAALSNHVLRVHLAVDVPDDHLNVSGLIVEDEIRFHREGEIIVFDDSLVHSAFNQHQTTPRTVLIFDLVRPPSAHPGTATGGTTPELEQFITEYFH